MIGRYTRQNELEYKNKRKEANHMFRNKKRALLHEKLSNISIEYNNQNARNFYKEVNYFKKGFKPQTKLIKNSKGEIISNEAQALERWKEYYEDHFKLRNERESEQMEQEVYTAEPLVEPPEMIDVEMAIEVEE
ncbi:hypothetical protein ANN_21676 [Periplaneta americana]|uniref:Uncharacterized protein n=1 Tax=Periplaneta americana TaxID=6978 RepID=A0ABQ8S640_PERAM|nr:hypothetical protein ANN_21676 [Periplaneta americana]